MKIEMAKKAAKWWADQLRGDAKLDNGDNNPLTLGLALMCQDAEKKNLDLGLVDKFESELSNALAATNIKSIGTDYGPCVFLQDIADKVGLKLGMTSLPWKTMMLFSENTVKVSCGYRAAFEIIFVEENN